MPLIYVGWATTGIVAHLPLSSKWWASGRIDPHEIQRSCRPLTRPTWLRNQQARYKLPKAEFINCVKSLGGIPREILEEPELIDFIEPILRYDFQALETYVYHRAAPFDIPITILHGLSDIEAAYQDLLAWQQETRQPIEIKRFQGGHFFIFDHLAELGQLFNQILIR